MDRRTLIAILLCFSIFMGWQKLYIEPRLATHVAPSSSGTVTQQSAPPTQEVPSAHATDATPFNLTTSSTRPPQVVTLKSQTGNITLTDTGRLIQDWTLNQYHEGLSDETPAISLPWVTQQKGAIEFAVEDPHYAYLSQVQGQLSATAEGAIWRYEDSNVNITREFTSNPTLPYVGLKITTHFKNKKPSYAFLSLASQKLEGKDREEQDRQLVYFTNNSIERVHLKESTPLKEVGTAVKYIGATSRYFLLALVSDPQSEPKALVQPSGVGAGRINLVYPITENSITIPVRIYFGPKDLTTLRSVDPTLDHTVDFGWFTLFAYPILQLLKWLYHFIGNYGVAIILLTILLKLFTFPLTYKSMKSMKDMARLQPQLQKLRDKYKDDRDALNREMMLLMKNHGYNPMAGCLPILIQMPIFFALYRVLYSSIDLYHAPFAFWIHDLSAPDQIYVTPILLSITMFIQQKLTPNTATDPMQAKMLQFMPLIFGAFMLTLPSGLTLYMLVNAISSIIQQLILNKKLDVAHVQTVPARSR